MKKQSTLFIFIIFMFISLTSTCNKSLNTLHWGHNPHAPLHKEPIAPHFNKIP